VSKVDVKEKLVELPIDDAILILKEEHKQRVDGYTTHLAYGGKGDPAEEVSLDALEMAIFALEQTRWISVKDRLPDLELVEAKTFDCDLYPCLVTIKNERAMGGRYVGKAWYDGKGFMDVDCVDITYEVTHWMPLPQPPKGG
jgi:hypothetical protein